VAKEEKINKVNNIKEVFKNNCGLIFTDHNGLKAEEAVQIRDRLIEVGSYLKIVKNTLALIAADEVFEDISLNEVFNGETSLVVIEKDVASTARVLKEFSEEHNALKIKAAILENELLDSEVVNKIASLPGREVLLTKLAISVKLPISNFVNVLGGITRNLVVVLNSIKQCKEKNSNL